MNRAPLTVEQLVDRLDVKCEEILMRPRPTKGDVVALAGLCRQLAAALEQEKRVADRNAEQEGKQQ